MVIKQILIVFNPRNKLILIECYVQKERLSLPQVQINNSVISEWRNIGFISTEADIKLLAKTVGKDAFAKLINCVSLMI